MRRNWLNYLAAAVFLFDAFRDWFFPGLFQLHAGSSDLAAVWFVLGCVFLATAVTRSRKAKRAR